MSASALIQVIKIVFFIDKYLFPYLCSYKEGSLYIYVAIRKVLSISMWL